MIKTYDEAMTMSWAQPLAAGAEASSCHHGQIVRSPLSPSYWRGDADGIGISADGTEMGDRD